VRVTSATYGPGTAHFIRANRQLKPVLNRAANPFLITASAPAVRPGSPSSYGKRGAAGAGWRLDQLVDAVDGPGRHDEPYLERSLPARRGHRAGTTGSVG
jgi:hypothetical protein